ncbi:YgiQ family radical SAM protein [Salinispira pacifica]
MKDSALLPLQAEEAAARGWDRVDFVCITGDAYVDHPSFGIAVISRLLEADGFRVALLAQPDWHSAADFKRFGRPRLGFLVTAGNLDSMVNGYTAARKRRSRDLYSPGGEPRQRPDRASIVYAIRAREAYKGVPVILGGLEASLRRLAHYDYWDDAVRRSVLLDAKADLLVYGMGESQIAEIARRLAAGDTVDSMTDIPGTVYAASSPPSDSLLLPSFEEIGRDRRLFAESFRLQYTNTDPVTGRRLAESCRFSPPGAGETVRWVVQNPPAAPVTREEMDRIYSLPYARAWHPSYDPVGGVPALAEVKFSLTSSRGCFGSCSFCALTFHQGRTVVSRSHESLVEEAQTLIRDPHFKGYIHDVGGPTANFRHPACAKQQRKGACPDRQCLFPTPCPSLKVDHQDYLALLRRIRKLPGLKRVFVRSGIRFDYLMADPDGRFFEELCEHHISGQLKVAPEHVSDTVLDAMGKPPHRLYRQFERRYREINSRIGKKQYLVPYFISGHPGSDLRAAVELAEYFRDQRFIPDQVQDFYPTPGTLATCMFHTGIDPRNGNRIYVPRSGREKAMQRALMQFRNPKNYRLVHDALVEAGREELIGYGKGCLITPRPPAASPGHRARRDRPAGGRRS